MAEPLDLNRIKLNVSKMVDQGAPETDIDQYISAEGVTLEQIRGHKIASPAPNPVKQFVSGVGNTIGNVVGGAATSVVDAVRGKQDPAYAGTPTFQPQTPQGLENQPYAKMTAFDDEAYADIQRKNLGDRFIRMERDKNNQPVIVYRDDKGGEAKGYVNQPGLDWQDVDRFASTAAPFLLGGGLATKAPKIAAAAAPFAAKIPLVGNKLAGGFANLAGGLSTTTGRIASQATAHGGTSLALDLAASKMGSEQGVDLLRAIIAAGFGAAGEAISPAISRWINKGARATDDEIAAAAKAAGVNPDELTPEIAETLRGRLPGAADPAEAMIDSQAGVFGIPTTKGQRTKDPQLLAVEKDIRAGNLGESAKGILDVFDRKQKQAIDDVALGSRVGTGVEEKTGIAGLLAPHRTRGENHPQTLGTSIREGMTSVKTASDDEIRAAWPKNDILPRPEAFESLPNALAGRLGPRRLDDNLTPTAMKMDAALNAYRSGNAVVEGGPQVVKQAPVKTVDEMRRHLLALSENATTPTDRAAAKAIYRGFDDWIEEAAEKGALTGSPADVAQFRAARELTREIKALFAPRDSLGKQTAGARVLRNVMETADSGESIVAKLFGGQGPQSPPVGGTVEALQRMKMILTRPKEGEMAAKAKDTWNDVRLAFWTRLVQDNKGNTLTPQMLQNNIEAVFKNQKSIMDTLYTKGERFAMRAFARAVSAAAYKDPNPSGTASALRAMFKNEDSLLKTGLQTQSKRELFSKHNVLMSRIYSMLAQKVPLSIFGSKEGMATTAARRATSSDLTPKPPRSLGGVTAGSYAGYDATND